MDPLRFVLKTTPPRAHRTAIARPRLDRLWSRVHDLALVEVRAPGGFGKSTVLVQWRRLWLEKGALVAWATLDRDDAGPGFAALVAYALRTATGRPAFDRYVAEVGDAFDALTGVLAEVASLATPTVLVLDDVENLPADAVERSLAYLVANAPANLTVVLGSRVELRQISLDAAMQAQSAVVGPEDMRFDLDETIALLRKRFGQRMELTDCARLHELTEGWPLGIQLAAAAVERAPHYQTTIASLTARHGAIARYFMETLLEHLPEELADFMTRIAILDPLSPELCEAVTQHGQARAWIEQLTADTPVFNVAEPPGWLRMHGLARDFLLGRFDELAPDERAQLHRSAATWLAGHDHLPEATRHALAAGDDDAVQSYAARSVWTLGASGNVVEAQAWLARLAPETLARDVGLRLTGAWISAFSDRVAQSRQVAADVLANPASSPEVRFVAALVASCAEACADRIGAIPALIAPWPQCPPSLADPVLPVAYANTTAVLRLYEGDTRAVTADRYADAALTNRSLQLAVAIARILAALARLREADPQAAEAVVLAPAVHAERAQGRRSTVACIYAACLAAALVERNEIERAEATLAHRLDVIERFILPDPIILASQALARIAVAHGDERRALAVLENLESLGDARDIPRFTMIARSMRVELHARMGHGETAGSLLAALAAMAPIFELPEYQPFRAEHRVRCAIGSVYVALANFDGDAAERELAQASELTANRPRDALTVKVLAAVAARARRSDRALPLLNEALSLAAMRGCMRLAEDTHPVAVAMRDELAGQPAPAATKPATRAVPAIATGGLLTPKEAEVLRLVAAGHSNKHIANAMNISDETVKWHLKNLFSKLSAGTRRHAVDRARMMGLIVDAAAT